MNQTNLVNKFVKGNTRGTASHMFIEGNVLYSYGYHFPLLVRRSFGFLLNADKYSVTTSKHQSSCFEHAKALIPFSILSRLNLDYNTVKIIDQSKERWDITGYHRWNPDIKKYDTSCSVSKYKALPKEERELPQWSKIEERRPSALIMANPENGKCYLTSMNNNNYFASELSKPVNTVSEAYDLLKPIEAKGIEGKDYLRQGEWFFIPCDGIQPMKSSIKKGMEKQTMYRRKQTWNEETKKYDYEDKVIKRQIAPIEFLHNRNKELHPHHYVTEYGLAPYRTIPNKFILVRGTVRHSNRDHRMLKLGNGKQWYMAIESNHVLSVGVGRVD